MDIMVIVTMKATMKAAAFNLSMMITELCLMHRSNGNSDLVERYEELDSWQ